MFADLRHRTAQLLPTGRRLPDAVCERRHRAIVRLSLACAVGLVLLAWVWGYGQPAAVAVLAAVAGPLVAGRRSRGWAARCTPPPPR